MKLRSLRSVVFVSALVLVSVVAAQTNTFPTTGNAGVGTTSPSHPFDVVGSNTGAPVATATNNADSAYVPIFETNAPNLSVGHVGYVGIGRAASTYNQFSLGFYYAGSGSTNNRLDINAYGVAPIMSFLASAKVGIGTSSPTHAFDVVGSDASYPIATFNNGANNAFVPIWEANAPNLAVGNSSYIAVGRNPAVSNQFSFNFYYAGNGSTSNRLDIGAYGIGSFMSILASGNIGIGTSSPAAKLDVSGSARINGVVNATDVGSLGVLNTRNGGGITIAVNGESVPGSTFGMSNVVLQTIQGNNSWGMGIGNVTNTPLIFGTNNAERVRIDAGGNVGIGTTNPTYKLSVNGTIRAKEVIVDTGWSDYVFEEGYRLAPLSEVAAYIKAKKHLPDIPTAAEVEKYGLGVGEMQSRLLAKIEELTLRQIEQERRIEQLEGENRKLSRQ